MIRDDQQFLVDIEMPDDIDVALDNDGLPKVVPKEQAKKEVKAETATKVAAPDTSEVDQLRRELAAERSARETAAAEAAAAKAAAEDERRARTGVERSLEERTVQAMQSHWAKVNADAKAIDTAIGSTKQSIIALQSRIKQAKEAGDHDKEAEAQSLLTDAQLDMRELERGKDGIAVEIERARGVMQSMATRQPAEPEKKKEPEVKQPEPQKQITPEQWIDTVAKEHIGDKGAEWLKDNKQFVTDPKLHKRLLRFAEEYAEDHGNAGLKSDDFLGALNKRFNIKTKEPDPEPAAEADGVIEVDTNPKEPEPAQKPVASAPAAPVSRSSPGKPSGTPAKVRLTAEQYAIAPGLFPDMTPEMARKEYASSLVRAQKEGRFERRE